MKSFFAVIPDDRSKHHPVEYSAILYRKLVTVHPFIDGNGRAVRPVMNLALLQAGYPMAIIPPVLRCDYLDTLNKTHKGDDKPFNKLIVGVCYESAREYLRLLEG